MSMGYGGLAILVDAGDTMLVYAYKSYNLNIDEKEYRGKMELIDGEIIIDRSALVEPILKEKIKKMSSGRKKLIKKVCIQRVDVVELCETGKIKVKNASGTWLTVEYGMDMVARNLCSKIFVEYQETGKIPERTGYYC